MHVQKGTGSILNKDNHLSAFPMSGSLRERVHWCRVASFTTEGVKPVLTNSCGIGIQETMWMRQEWGSVFKCGRQHTWKYKID